jgi:arabinogalactan oligomer/maltooligosaccharide transport system permease protein
MALVDALGVYAVILAWSRQSWVIAAFLVISLIAANVVYFSRRMTPAKYLLPGLFFLAVYQIFVIAYTGYAAFTNYGDGHNSTKDDAIAAIEANSFQRVPDSAGYPLTVLEKGSDLAFLVTEPDGSAALAAADEPLAPAPEATFTGSKATGLEGYTTLALGDLLQRQSEILALQAPLGEDPSDGVLRTPDGSTAYAYLPVLVYDEAADNFTDTSNGDVYRPSEDGRFVDDSGQALEQGWRVFIGAKNFTSVLTEPSLRGPFWSVLIWTFVFAISSVALSYFLGLALAIVLNHPSVRGRKIYRSLLILPYAFPAFLSVLVWQGIFNPQFGFMNTQVLGGADIQWLTDPWLARLCVIVVNVWMTFPYMFLISTGAIQSLSSDVMEAASIDGAGWFQIFRLIKLPLLLVSTAPLLISSFAMNFNNFNSIYMLTEGGPLKHPTDQAGSTDILISFVYRLAFSGVNKQYGLACAISMMIFVIVATISALSFRRTGSLEEMN